MRSQVFLVLVLALCLVILVACGRNSNAVQSPASAVEAITWSQNGLSDAERAVYHHLAEGSELMPYALLANLVSTKTGKPFLENMERFGFVPDSSSTTNPHGLPIGLTVVRSRNRRHIGLEMVGFNCAACHVGELTYRGKRLRIDGAPSLVDLQGYQIELKDSLDATLRDPLKAASLAIAIDHFLLGGTPSGGNATTYAADPAAKNAGNVDAVPTSDNNFHSVPSHQADVADLTASLRGESFAERFRYHLALAKSWLAYLKHGKLLLDGTEPGPGRIDAFGAARNLLFSKDAVRMQSPVSFPFIWDVPDNTGTSGPNFVWIHYDGDTNSILERNIGQALGMGALFDKTTFESTLRIKNLHRLEQLIHELKPPKWPADMVGPIDEGKAKMGEKIFDDNCRACHQNRLHSVAEVGTDPRRAKSFGKTVARDVPFPTAVKPILDSLKARAFADDGISVADQAIMDANPVIWRVTGEYLARPLDGVWATAPYLHNGSVPTLWHLLHPAQRPAQFVVGNREYDPAKVGYSTDGNGWKFDTSLPGNSNVGHSGDKYGTNLTEDQKAELLEYLKTI